MDYHQKLEEIEQEIKALENSEEYKILAEKNRAWADPKPTEREKGEWGLLKEKLAELESDFEFYKKVILSMNARAVKKSEKARYKMDAAINDQMVLLAIVAKKRWERFGFKCAEEDKPSFQDFKRASGFKDDEDVLAYFKDRANGKAEKDDIKESLSEKQWIWFIAMDQSVNLLQPDRLSKNDDGSISLMLEHEFYEGGGAKVVENIIHTLYGSETKVYIQDASSDS